MKAFWISIISTIFISIIYHFATQKFEIPFFYTISVGIIIFSLMFFALSDLEI